MKAPPLLPEETLHRVLRVANTDGLSVMAVAGLLALAAAAVHDLPNAAIGLLVAAAGAIELHGAALLRAGHSRGMNWLIASQPYLLLVLVGYCGLQLWVQDVEPLADTLNKTVSSTLVESGYQPEELAGRLYTPVYVALAIGTAILQGGMTLYYWRRRDAVIAAVGDERRDH